MRGMWRHQQDENIVIDTEADEWSGNMAAVTIYNEKALQVAIISFCSS